MDIGEFTNRGSHFNIDIIPEFHEYKKEFAIRRGNTDNFEKENDEILSPDPIGVKQKLK
jgi:hypothetical protein